KHFWLSLSDWDVIFWCKGVAVNAGLDVIVREPDVSPLQLQGPKSKDVMVALFGEEILDLEYYHLTETQLDGIPLVITRTGWSAKALRSGRGSRTIGTSTPTDGRWATSPR